MDDKRRAAVTALIGLGLTQHAHSIGQSREPQPQQQLENYAKLRMYSGSANCIHVVGTMNPPPGIAGTFIRDPYDATSIDNGGTIIVSTSGVRWKRVFSGALNVRWFGAKGDGVSDDTAASQAMADAALSDPARPIPMYYPSGIYKHSGDIVINSRDSNVKSMNPAQLLIFGDSGRGDANAAKCGTTIHFSSGQGTILRICEEVDGGYPGGGLSNVARPLSYLRSIVVRDINFAGNSNDPTAVNGISGRGIFASVVERCGFIDLNYGIRFGKAGHNIATEASINEGISIDYCERNRISNCSFRNVQYQIHILNPDITVIEGNMLSGTVNARGHLIYWAGGNDFLDIRNNIFHPVVFSTSEQIEKAIVFFSVRGVDFHDNHCEYVGSDFFFGSGIEYLRARSNLFTAKTAPLQVFNLAAASQALIDIDGNSIAMPQPRAFFIKILVPGDDSNFTKLRTVKTFYSRNRAVSSLGGKTPIDVRSNIEQVQLSSEKLSRHNQIGSIYVWADTNNKLRLKPIAAGHIESDSDGLALQTDANGPTANRPKTTNKGEMYYDTSLGKPVWWNGKAWTDALGNPV